MTSLPAAGQDAFTWPEGKRMALSLTFDDGRTSQVDQGLPLFTRYDAKATFYVVPGAVVQRLEGWKTLAAQGHEIGNHTLNHPCSGNFAWARDKALETYTLSQMRDELAQASERIEELLGVRPESFAYPCGQTFVGRGIDTRSYVPLIAHLFTSGRTWLDEAPNDPSYVDFAQLTGMEMDGKDFEAVRLMVENAAESGAWLVLAGHDIGQDGPQTTRVGTLEKLLAYASDPVNGVWIAPVAEVRRYIDERRRTDSLK